MNQISFHAFAEFRSPLFLLISLVMISCVSCRRIEQIESVQIGGGYILSVDRKMRECTIALTSSGEVVEPSIRTKSGIEVPTVGALERFGNIIVGHVESTSNRHSIIYYFIIDTTSGSHESRLNADDLSARLQALNVPVPAVLVAPEEWLRRLMPVP